MRGSIIVRDDAADEELETTAIRTCAIIGSGVAAQALGPALVEDGIQILSVSGRNRTTTERLAQVTGAEVQNLLNVGAGADLLILTVGDRAIPPVVQELASRTDLDGMAIVHMSGGLGAHILNPLTERGAAVGKLHPLASLAGGPQRLTNIAWGFEGNESLSPKLRALIERLDGLPVDLTLVDLDLYHLAAVFSSNFLLGLLSAAVRLWEESGAPIPASEALLPLIRGTLANWDEVGLDNALTGPIVRGDGVAVARQLSVLTQRMPQLTELYRELALVTVEIAENRKPEDGAIAEIGRFLAKSEMVD